MIQRIQSIYLLLITAISIILLNLNTPFFTEENREKSEMVLVDYNSTDVADLQAQIPTSMKVGTNAGLVYFLYAVALLSFISIFLYKNRKLQSRIVMAVLIFAVVVMVDMYWYSYQMEYFESKGTTSLKPIAFVPLSLLLFAFLALRGVLRDEQLVRSLDRIR